jgi:hypothetical protein
MIYDRINIGVTKGKYLSSRRKYNECNIGTTKSAKLASFLEEPTTALRESNLHIAIIRHPFHFNLSTTLGFPSA